MDKLSLSNAMLLTCLLVTAFATPRDSYRPGAPQIKEFSFFKTEHSIGDNATAICIVNSGQTPFRFRWLKNGNPLNPQAHRVSIGNVNLVSTLEVLDTRESDHGNYTCEVSNQVATSRATAELRIFAPPVWSFVEEDKIVAAGQNTSLRCEASGLPPPKITWKFSSDNAQSYVQIDNENTYWLTKENNRLDIHGLAKHHEGIYRCEASNAKGDSISKEIQLRIEYPPVFTYKQENVSVGIGGSVDLRCETEPSVPADIMWNRVLSVHTHFELSSGDMYPDGSQRAPVSKKYIGAGSRLTLNSLKNEESSFYECVATNPKNGLKTSQMFYIAVKSPARVHARENFIQVRRDENARLECPATGEPPLKVEWMRQQSNGVFSPLFDQNQMPLSADLEPLASSRVTSFANMITDQMQFHMQIAATRAADSGVYMCKVTNAFGEDSARFRVTVQDVPDSPIQVTMDQVWSRSAQLHWTAPSNTGNSALTGYVIQYWREKRTDRESIGSAESVNGDSSPSVHRLYELDLPASETSATITENLQPGRSYRIRVYAVNALGKSRKFGERRFELEQEEPSLPPSDMRLLSRTSNTIKLAWRAPPIQSWNGALTGYFVGYRSLKANEVQEAREHPQSIKNDSLSYNTVRFSGSVEDEFHQEYILSGLTKSTHYYVIVRAVNRVGQGPYSQPLVISTSAHDPPSPPKMFVEQSTRDSIIIRWTQPKEADAITHYILSYRDEKSTWLEITFDASATSTYTLKGLHEATQYELYLRAGSHFGTSEPSKLQRQLTKGSASGSGLLQRMGNMRLLGSSANGGNIPPYLRSHVVIPVCVALVLIAIICSVAIGYVKYEEKKAIVMRANLGMMASSPSKHFMYGQTQASGGETSSSNTSTYQQIGMGDSLLSDEGSICLRYSDADKSKPLLSRPPSNAHHLWSVQQQHKQQMGAIAEESENCSALDDQGYPAPYATLALKKLSTFNGGPGPSGVPPPLPVNRPPALARQHLGNRPLRSDGSPHHVYSEACSGTNLLNLSAPEENASIFNSTLDNNQQALLNGAEYGFSPNLRQIRAEVHHADDSDGYDFFKPSQI